MKKNLMNIAMQLSENDISELLRLKKTGDKKLVGLRKERRKLLTQLARIEKHILALGVELEDDESAVASPVAKKRGRPAKTATAEPSMKRKGRKKGKRGRSPGLSENVKKVMAAATAPMRAGDIVDALPGMGFKIKDAVEARKRVSIVLASQKNYFKQVSRGLYELA